MKLLLLFVSEYESDDGEENGYYDYWTGIHMVSFVEMSGNF